MSTAVPAAPTIFDGQNILLFKINEILIEKFPMSGQLAPGPYDTIEELLYKLAYNLNLVPSTGGAGNYFGSGSPEGVQVAAVGSRYWDYTNEADYVKRTGTGSTGWEPPLIS